MTPCFFEIHEGLSLRCFRFGFVLLGVCVCPPVWFTVCFAIIWLLSVGVGFLVAICCDTKGKSCLHIPVLPVPSIVGNQGKP